MIWWGGQQWMGGQVSRASKRREKGREEDSTHIPPLRPTAMGGQAR